MQANSSRLRKGAWTEEEDALLRKCIHKYGEGKWHQVPARAGLNRCRKSCRLRWLNYLRPDIKRGDFTADEVDLIIRLHQLLGNRWSLIAGRLPGRTANDVKNHWNTHLLKRVLARREVKEDNINVNNINRGGIMTTQPTLSNVIFKPQPRTFSKNPSWLKGKTTCSSSSTTTSKTTKSKDKSISTDDLVIGDSPPFPTSSLRTDDQEKDNNSSTQYWWEDLLFLDKEEQGPTWSFGGGGDGGSWWSGRHVTSLFSKESPPLVQEGGKDGGVGGNQECQIDDLYWDLLLSDQPAMQSFGSL